ncbi:MAG TPA: N-acetyl-gamma-glutamyl-phosphate reductase [Dehalococcoidia bacterium]|nr:N-acetyl-gamma-glutamyl-phosphate reductase [Dehalococcoidia bacterium]
MPKIKTSIINVTGYIGAELARLLYQHPQVELKSVTGRSAAGQKLGDIFPHLSDTGYLIKSELDNDIDVAFSAMPHKTSVDIVPSLLRKGIKVIDVSADFRLKNADEYPRWYKFNHPAPELLKEAVYGLPELHRTEISSASLVANPGCYSTGAILALAPAVKEGLIHQDIIIDSKSGVSGAGRTLSLATHYSEANENTYAYSIEGHRHLAEIEQELGRLNPESHLSISFVPHLVPMTRGILSSCYATLKDDKQSGGAKAKKELYLLYQEFYRDAPFIRVVSEPPQTKHAWGNNFCFIYPTIDSRTGRLIVISCLDNLVKGGAGQAVQNMNLMFGLPETSGLETMAIYP